MYHTYFLRVGSIACLVAASIASIVSPSLSGPSESDLRMPEQCAISLENTSGFKEFVAANDLSPFKREYWEKIYVHRGLQEWRSFGLLDQSVSEFGEGVSGESYRSGIFEDNFELTPEIERAVAALKLGRNNPLSLMKRVATARAMGSKDNAGARAILDAAIIDGVRVLGRDNAGLISAFALDAELQARMGLNESADRFAARALDLIAAHDERAVALGATKVNLLVLRANIAQDRLDALSSLDKNYGKMQANLEELREQARLARNKLALSLGSPFFDFAALIPGAQPLVEWTAEKESTTVAGQFALFQELSFLAGLVPSQPHARNRSSTVRINSGAQMLADL